MNKKPGPKPSKGPRIVKLRRVSELLPLIQRRRKVTLTIPADLPGLEEQLSEAWRYLNSLPEAFKQFCIVRRSESGLTVITMEKWPQTKNSV